MLFQVGNRFIRFSVPVDIHGAVQGGTGIAVKTLMDTGNGLILLAIGAFPGFLERDKGSTEVDVPVLPALTAAEGQNGRFEAIYLLLAYGNGKIDLRFPF